ncbi:MAG TPA: sodium:proton antiporter [Bacillota bacterium]|nr:sodium:proton antiporter [Bacillota bacterium]
MHEKLTIPVFVYLPFVILLLIIAILPLFRCHFWEKNRNKAVITAILSIPVAWYLLVHFPQELAGRLEEYVSFILLLASLFIISGGILVTGDLRATPKNNTIFLFLGAVLANLVGTTGASMLLIRPLFKSISERKHIYHIPIFFIILVSNIGGSLTPLGDPPLFLGYLNGVPFLWTLKLFPIWLTAVSLLLGLFYIWDRICYRKEEQADRETDNRATAPVRISGKVNFIFLIGIIITVLLQIKSPYRELIMAGMIGLSLQLTPRETRRRNGFTFHPILEVAVLFAGIFITMVPLLILLDAKGAGLGVVKPWQFFWLTGGMSSFLDNAPTYVSFAALAESVTKSAANHLPVVAGIREDLLIAISCGAVFMGANTYIGNGPNFMVKSIAEEQGIKMPHFFEYMLYSGVILLPVFLLLTFLFFV